LRRETATGSDLSNKSRAASLKEFSIEYPCEALMKGEIKFVADAMLGRLAKWLRVLGYDTLYYRGTEAEPLLSIARREERVLLTRNTRISTEEEAPDVLLISDDHWDAQLRQVVERFNLAEPRRAFTRCVNCNTALWPLSREQAKERVPEHIYHVHLTFRVCPLCQRVYWQGSHQKRMQAMIQGLYSGNGDPS